MTGKCNLCLKEKELIEKSHIIPEFMYRNSGDYDDKHRMNAFDKEDILQNHKVRKEQSGINDGGILCADCDNVIIGGYEANTSMKIYELIAPTKNCSDCINYGETNPVFSVCTNVDYKKNKLFLLSVLFRASISKNPFFDEVKLSNENQEVLRKMIYEGNPGNHNDFPFLVSTFTNSQITPDIFLSPDKSNQDGFTTYTFVFAGMSYVFYEGINLNTNGFDFWVMKPDNELKIFHINEEQSIEFLKRITGQQSLPSTAIPT